MRGRGAKKPKARERGTKHRRTVVVTAAVPSSPRGPHGPVLQMSAQSGPPWEASKTPLGSPGKQITTDVRELSCHSHKRRHSTASCSILHVHIYGPLGPGFVQSVHAGRSLLQPECGHEFASHMLILWDLQDLVPPQT